MLAEGLQRHGAGDVVGGGLAWRRFRRKSAEQVSGVYGAGSILAEEPVFR